MWDDPFSAALAGVMAHKVQQHEQVNMEAKAVDAFVKAHPEILAKQGVHEEEYKGYGSKDKVAMFSSMIQYGQQQHTDAALAELEQQTKEHMARISEFNAQATQRGQDDRDSQIIRDTFLNQKPEDLLGPRAANPNLAPLPAGMSAVNQTNPDPSAPTPPDSELINPLGGPMPTAGTGTTTSIDPRMLVLKAMQKGLSTRGAERFGNVLKDFGGQAGEDLTSTFSQDPVTGARFYNRGKSTLPSGQDPNVGMNTLPQVPGYTPVPTGRGRVEWMKTQDKLTPAQLLTSYDEDLKYLGTDSAMSSMTPEERASMRVEIQAKRDKLRGTTAATAGTKMDTPANRAAFATNVATTNPKWTRAQVLAEVEKHFAK